jgi:hypothetical protein
MYVSTNNNSRFKFELTSPKLNYSHAFITPVVTKSAVFPKIIKKLFSTKTDGVVFLGGAEFVCQCVNRCYVQTLFQAKKRGPSKIAFINQKM